MHVLGVRMTWRLVCQGRQLCLGQRKRPRIQVARNEVLRVPGGRDFDSEASWMLRTIMPQAGAHPIGG